MNVITDSEIFEMSPALNFEKVLLITLFLTIPAFFSSDAMAEESDFRVLEYGVLQEGEDVGDITLHLSHTRDGYLIVEHNHIKTSGWWGEIDITIVMFEEFRHGIGLIRADSKIVDGVTAYWSRINRHENGFLGEFTETSKMSTRATQHFFKLSSAVTRREIFATGEVILLSEAIFSDRNEPVHSVNFTQNSFDTTFSSLPFFIQKNIGKPLPKILRILDTESLEITQTNIKNLGLETILVGNKKIQAHHFIFSNTPFKPSHVWIKADITSLPYIVRHTGEDEDGLFEISIKHK